MITDDIVRELKWLRVQMESALSNTSAQVSAATLPRPQPQPGSSQT